MFFHSKPLWAIFEGSDNVTATILHQQVFHILEELQVAALVGGDGDALYVFLDGAFHDLRHRPVMSQVDDLGTLGLQQPPHDVDRGIVSVEQRRGSDEANFMYRTITHVQDFGKQGKFSLKN